MCLVLSEFGAKKSGLEAGSNSMMYLFPIGASLICWFIFINLIIRFSKKEVNLKKETLYILISTLVSSLTIGFLVGLWVK